jgi:GDP-L-fucose synthase
MSFYTNKKVLVAGAGGFCGHAIVKKLLEDNAIVYAGVRRSYDIQHKNLTLVNYDFSSKKECLLAAKGMDVIIDSVAQLRGAAGLTENPIPYICGNLFPAIALAEASAEMGVDRFGAIGSTTMYPESDLPVKESEAFDSIPHGLYFGFGVTKRYSEQIYSYFQSVSNTKFGIIRASSIYGPHDYFDFSKNHVVPDIIMRADKRENPFVIWGDGTQIRDFIYVNDMVDGLLLTIEKYATADPINIASGRDTTIRELVETISDLMGYNPQLEYNLTKPTMVPIRRVDISKAKEAIGWQPKFDLRESLKITIDWYMENKKR